MGRKKLTLAYISDETMRRQAFNQRKEELTRKLEELKTLCGVDVCAVIYNDFNTDPEVWPSNSEVDGVIERFKNLTKNNQTDRSVSQEEFLRQCIAKEEKKRKRMIEENHEACMKEAMFKCIRGKKEDLDMDDSKRLDLCKYIDQYLKALYYHKDVTLRNAEFETGESSSMAMVENNMMMTPTNMATNMAPIIPEATFMAPTTVGEGSASSFPNGSSFEASSGQGLENVNSLATNLFPNNDQELQISSVNQSIIPPSNQGPEDFNSLDVLPNNNQEDYTPVMDQNAIYDPNQKENPQRGIVDEMMKYAEQTGFPWMDDDDNN